MNRREVLRYGALAGLVAALPAAMVRRLRSRIDHPWTWASMWQRHDARPAGQPAAVHAWDAEQVGAFLDATEGHRLHPLYHLAAYTGMRRGELCGLSWDDVDLDARRITVRWQITGGQRGCHRSRPKTVGDRVVHVDETAVDVLRTWREQQYRERTDRIPAYVDLHDEHGPLRLVFTREDGSPLDPRSVSRQFTKLAEQAGLGRRAFHGLREVATSGQALQQS